jgi:hypothetical protein
MVESRKVDSTFWTLFLSDPANDICEATIRKETIHLHMRSSTRTIGDIGPGTRKRIANWRKDTMHFIILSDF